MKGTCKLFFAVDICATLLALCTINALGQPARSRAGIEVQRRDQAAVSANTSQSKGSELRCRGGAGAFTFEKYGQDRQLPSGETQVVLRLTFRASPLAAGMTGSGLQPGTCSWVDQPLSNKEPRAIVFDTLANAQLKQTLKGTPVDRSPTAAENYPDAITIPVYLGDRNHYFTFSVNKVLLPMDYFPAQEYGVWKPSVIEKRPTDLMRQP